MKLQNKVAVITGGSSGIGLATAHELRANGARIALFARDERSLATAKEALGEDVVTVAGDVRNVTDLDRLFDETERRLGKVDVVVAAAGSAALDTRRAAREAHRLPHHRPTRGRGDRR